MIPIEGLFEAHISVRDFERSVAFYRDVVGLELAKRCFWILLQHFFEGRVSRIAVTPDGGRLLANVRDGIGAVFEVKQGIGLNPPTSGSKVAVIPGWAPF